MTGHEILVLFPTETLPTGRVETLLGFSLELVPFDESDVKKSGITLLK